MSPVADRPQSRRRVVSLNGLVVVIALVAAQLTAEAQQTGKVPRVALVVNTSPVENLRDPERRGPVLSAFVQRLRELGWVDGQRVAFVWLSAGGRPGGLPDIL